MQKKKKKSEFCQFSIKQYVMQKIQCNIYAKKNRAIVWIVWIIWNSMEKDGKRLGYNGLEALWTAHVIYSLSAFDWFNILT